MLAPKKYNGSIFAEIFKLGDIPKSEQNLYIKLLIKTKVDNKLIEECVKQSPVVF